LNTGSGDLVLGDQLACLLGEQRPVRRRVDDHGLELLAENAAFLVLLIDEEQHRVFQRGLADRHRAGKRMKNADLDGVLSRRRQYGGKSQGETGRGHQPSAGHEFGIAH
jgi:hypothetical protein